VADTASDLIDVAFSAYHSEHVNHSTACENVYAYVLEYWQSSNLTNARLRHLAAFSHPVEADEEAEADEPAEGAPLQLDQQEIDEHVDKHAEHDEAEFEAIASSRQKRATGSDGEVEEQTGRGARARKAARFTIPPWSTNFDISVHRPRK
jgi:hypothetical protein